MAETRGWSSSDWYKAGEGQLHFFPGQKRMIWTVGKRLVTEAEAWGGEEPKRGVHYSTMLPRPTTPGSYVIQGLGPYHTRTWPWSRISWGTPLRVDPGDGHPHLLYQTGSASNGWDRVDRVIPGVTVSDVRDAFWALYADSRTYDSNGDGIPDVWVFNDFGPWAVRYYRDPNRNRRLDRGERLMGEMIHTTPNVEAQADRGLPVRLSYSHGCIHIKPFDRGRFLNLGAFKTGNLIVVHQSSEVVPELLAR